MLEMSSQCMMLSMSEQGNPHIAHHLFVDMYGWYVGSVLAVVSKSAQKATHSPQLPLKPCMFDISCSAALQGTCCRQQVCQEPMIVRNPTEN